MTTVVTVDDDDSSILYSAGTWEKSGMDLEYDRYVLCNTSNSTHIPMVNYLTAQPMAQLLLVPRSRIHSLVKNTKYILAHVESDVVFQA